MSDSETLLEWVELGAYDNVIVNLKGMDQRTISSYVWNNIHKSREVPFEVYMNGGDRYCYLRDLWTCGFWRPAFVVE